MQVNQSILVRIIKRILVTGFFGLVIGLCLITSSYLFWAIFKSAFIIIFSWTGISSTIASLLSLGVIVFTYIILILASIIEGASPE